MNSLQKRLCPQCRTDIVSRAPNIPLQQITLNYIEKQRAMDREREKQERQERIKRMKQGNEEDDIELQNNKTVQTILEKAPKNRLPEVEDFLREYRRCMTRKKVLENAIQENGSELHEVEEHEIKAKDHLNSFQEQASLLTGKIRQLQLELEKVQKKEIEQTEVVRYTHQSLLLIPIVRSDHET